MKFKFRISTVEKYADFLRAYNGQKVNIYEALKNHGMKKNAIHWERAGVAQRITRNQYLVRSTDFEKDAFAVVAQMAAVRVEKKRDSVKPNLPISDEVHPISINADVEKLLKKLIDSNEDLRKSILNNAQGNFDELYSSTEMDCIQYRENIDLISAIKSYLKK